MEFADVVRRRRMVRDFDAGRSVDPAVVDQMLEHAVRAPSAGFSQGWAFLVLEGPADRDLYWRATTPLGGGTDSWSIGMRRAPVLIVALSSKRHYLDRYARSDKGWTDRDELRWPVPYWHVDTGMAALLMLLTVTDHELGGCFFGVPTDHVEAFRTAFGVPDDHHPVGVVAVGYPAPGHRSGPRRKARRPTEEVVHRGRW